MKKPIRIEGVDGLRGIAIIAMIIYHFLFDLQFFNISPISIQSWPMIIFQRFIGTLFLLVVGISIVLSTQKNEPYIHFVKRALFLGLIAAGITLATFIYPHDGFIQFGIIHFIAVATLIAPLFLRFTKALVPLGIGIIGLGWWMSSFRVDSPYLFWLGLTNNQYYALDHYPLLPWLGVVLIGMYVGKKIMQQPYSWTQHPLINHPRLTRLGKKSLFIYLIHQPILIALIMIIRSTGLI